MVVASAVVSRVAPALLAIVVLAGCNGVWGLDEVTVGDGAGASGASTASSGGSTGSASTSGATTNAASSTSSGGGDGGSGTTTAGTGGAGGSDCEACGCPSTYFPHGDLETDDDMSGFSFQEGDCVGMRMESGATCGAMRLADATNYCTYSHEVSQLNLGGKCAVGRVRAAASDADATLFVGLLGLGGPDLVLVDDQIGPDPIDIPIACEIPEPFTVERAYLAANIGTDGRSTFDIDFVELDVVSCEDAEDIDGLCDFEAE